MSRLKTFLHLRRGERLLVLTALVYAAGARLVVSWLSFPALCRLLEGQRLRRDPAHAPERVAWAVAATDRLLPRSTCLTQAIAAHWLLRRGGSPAVLWLGVLGGAGEGFRAHAWVESEGRILIGGGTVEGFTRLARIG
jgi:hypothetical protein